MKKQSKNRVATFTAAALSLALLAACSVAPGSTGTTGMTGTSKPAGSEGVKQYTAAPAVARYDEVNNYYTAVNSPQKPVLSVEMAKALRSFSRESFRLLFQSKADDNLLYVPLSLYMDLSMLTDATTSQTRADLDRALNQGEDITAQARQEAMKALLYSYNKEIVEGDIKARLANAIWLKDSYKYTDGYQQLLEDVYQADSYTWAQGAEKSASAAMGRWVEDNTFGLLPASTIPDDLPRSTTLMVLLNALYYKCSWGFEFDPELNTKAPFQLPDGSTVEAEFMNQTIYKSRGVIEAQYQAADIIMSDLSRMRFVLPNEGIEPEDLLENDGFWRDLLDLQADDSAIVNWTIPKSDVNGKMDLLPLLEDLGLGSLMKFMDMSAGLEGSPDAFLSEATQAVRIKMHEKGVEAAAVTVLAVDESAPMNPPEIDMKLDRPFFAALISPEGQAIFLAYIEVPQSK